MTIDKAARRTGISKDMIRHYEKLGLVKPMRKENGYREYSEDDLNTLVLIRMLSNSHIPLKEIQRSFYAGATDRLLVDFEKEIASIRKLRSQLDTRETALLLEMSCFEQYAENRGPQICHYPKRWVVLKADTREGNFKSVYQRIAEEDAYFHYLACQDIMLDAEVPVPMLYRQGVLLYHDFPQAELIPEQDCLRVILTHEPGRMLDLRDYTPFIRMASSYTNGKVFRILAYQIFHHMGVQEKCVICVEILLGDSCGRMQ